MFERRADHIEGRHCRRRQGFGARIRRTNPAENPILLVRVDDSWDGERLADERERFFPTIPDVDR